MRRGLAVLLAVALALGGCGFFRGAPRPETPLDLNTASVRRIERLPGITPSMARRIVESRPYTGLDDLVDRDVLTERELDRIADHATVGEDRR